MSDVAPLLSASLQPASRKQAEQQLNQLTAQPGFLPHLLALILDSAPDRAVRLAGGIYLKNIAKLRWEEVRRRTQQDSSLTRTGCRNPPRERPRSVQLLPPSPIPQTRPSAHRSPSPSPSSPSSTFSQSGPISSTCVLSVPITSSHSIPAARPLPLPHGIQHQPRRHRVRPLHLPQLALASPIRPALLRDQPRSPHFLAVFVCPRPSSWAPRHPTSTSSPRRWQRSFTISPVTICHLRSRTRMMSSSHPRPAGFSAF